MTISAQVTFTRGFRFVNPEKNWYYIHRYYTITANTAWELDTMIEHTRQYLNLEVHGISEEEREAYAKKGYPFEQYEEHEWESRIENFYAKETVVERC